MNEPADLRQYLAENEIPFTEKDEKIKVGGSLDLRRTQISELPEGLQVGGSLDLRGTQISELPEGLQVGEYLDLEGTQISKLPKGLQVGGYLYVRGTQIPVWSKENIGSRSDTLYGVLVGSEPHLVTGCFFGTADDFLSAVSETHRTNVHAEDYKSAVNEFLSFLKFKPD